jgi:hypothetical protein
MSVFGTGRIVRQLKALVPTARAQWHVTILRAPAKEHARTRYGLCTGFPGQGCGLEQPRASGNGGGVSAVRRAELAEDVGDVELDGARSDVEAVSDLRVGEALAEQAKHFLFA